MRTEPITNPELSDLGRWVHERVREDADLGRPELASLVVALAAEPQFWSHLVRHDPSTRYFAQLYRDPHLDLWLICWLDAQDTGYHDHDLSAGAVYVCEGTLHEDFFVRGSDGWIREETNEHLAGIGLPLRLVVHPRSPSCRRAPATSLHAYSPALWRMGHYEPDDKGAVRRLPITYADELAAAG